MSTNEGFLVSALKYRPAEWEEVVGQSAITSTLKNAIAREEIAKAYLFCGPRGVGKTTSARIFAKAINSKYIEDGQDLSFNVFELDAASNNSVDDIRQLIDQVRIQPQLGKYKVYIIDEVHMLSTQAFNAFLKTLEEPPPHAIFILATTEKHKVIPTILSRCQIYDFQRIQVKDMVTHLGRIAEDQGVTYEEEALHLIATKADGALRDALSLFDQMVSFTGKSLEYAAVASNLNVLDYEYFGRIVKAITSGEVGEALLVYDEILKKGFDSLLFMIGLAEHLRNLLVAKDPSTVQLLDAPDAVKQKYLAQSAMLDSASIVKHLEQIHKTEVNYRTAKNKRLLTEITLMQLCASHGISSNGAIEKKKSSVAIESPSAAVPDQATPLPVVSQANISDETIQALGVETAPTKDVSPAPEITPAPELDSTTSETAHPADILEGLAPESTPDPTELKPEEAKGQEPNQIPLTAKKDPVTLPSTPIHAQTKPSSEELIMNAVKVTKTEAISYPESGAASQQVAEEAPKPIGRSRRKRGISLDELDEEDAHEVSQDIDQGVGHIEGKTVAEKELMIAWKSYAEIIYEEKKYSFHSTLINRKPEIINDHTIKLILENHVQKEHLDQEKGALMAYLREKLNHSGLALESEISEEDISEVSFKTSQDQLREMVKKNPTLQKLYEQFDLDVE